MLFCDLGGSTTFGERTDAEVARETMARYHAILQDVIDLHGGTVAKFMGDGMMATFGIPTIAEDDAERAVAAGLDVQRRFATFAADVESRYGQTLTLRVGVNTGEVVTGEGDADLIGDALNVAARLEKACRPGHVLVGEETWRLTRNSFGFESLGEVSVAGRAQPVAIYEVSEEAGPIDSVAQFIGRDAEIRRLRAVFDSAVATQATHLVTILGDPGVGKTRLSRELCAQVTSEAAALTFEIRCDRAGNATFAPVAQLIRTATGLGDDAEASVARTLVRDLFAEGEPDRERLADILAGLVGAAPSRSVEETFWAIRRLVESVATSQPMVVVIDDIQWAETLLLDLLEHLAEWTRGVAVLLVGLGRPELREVRPSLVEVGRRVAELVSLEGLDAAATEQLAAGLLGTDRLPAGLVVRLPASTDGNPLFVRELVRMLVDDQVIRQIDGVWELAIDADAVEVPPTIQSLLAARVERLPDDERSLLELASVIGVEFGLGALREIAGRGGTAIEVRLERMRRKDLVEPTGTYWGDEPVHRFHHVLIRDASYRRLLKTSRADLHTRVALWTDRMAADLMGEHEAVVAYHYEQAYNYHRELGALDANAHDLGRRAAELLSTAAHRALERDDLPSSGALAIRALALLPGDDVAARAELLLVACECLLASGDVAHGTQLVAELGAVARGDATLAALAACYEAQLIGLTDPDRLNAADEMATAAAASLESLGDGAGEAKAHQVRAGVLARLGRVGDAEVELDLALSAARKANDRRRVAAVLGAAPVAALWGPSSVARAGGRCLDVVRLLRITTASPSVEATSMRCQAVLEALRGRLDVSRSMLASARASLEELGLQHGLMETELLTGVVELISGDPAAAIGPLRAAYHGLGVLGVGPDAGWAAALLARAYLALGQVDDADGMVTSSERLAGQNLKTAIAWRSARAAVLAAQGRAAEGLVCAEAAVEIAAATDLILDHADACSALATLREACGDLPGAQAARADAVQLYQLKGATVPAGRLVPVAALQEVDERQMVGESAAPTHESQAASDPTANQVRPTLENLLTRTLAQNLAKSSSGDFDMSPEVADDSEHIDRRTVVATPPLYGRAAFEDVVRSMFTVFDRVTYETLAIRGEQYVLSRVAMVAEGGFEAPMLTVFESDLTGRIVRDLSFDADNLVGAIAELEDRYITGEGAADSAVLRSSADYFAALARRDWAALEALLAGDLVQIDHRGLWPPATGRDEFVPRLQTLVDATPDATVVVRKLHVIGPALLQVAEVAGTGPYGEEFRFTINSIQVWETGLLNRVEFFDEDQYGTALARLDDLGAPEPAIKPSGPSLENQATRAMARSFAKINAGDLDASSETAENVEMIDRRRVVSVPPTGDRATLEEATRWGMTVFDRLTIEPVAVRGNRLALFRVAMVTDSGFISPMLIVSDCDAHGRLCRQAVFDDDSTDDLLTAFDELENRYCAGEGAAHAYYIRRSGDQFRSHLRRDWASNEALFAFEAVIVNHRKLAWPLHDRASLRESMQLFAEQVPDILLTPRTIEVDGDATLGIVEMAGHSTDGLYSSWLTYVVQRHVAGLVVHMEMFDVEDEANARTRFEELADEDPRTPHIDNDAARTIARTAWLWEAGETLDQQYADDAESIDRRTGVSAPTRSGREAVVGDAQVVRELFPILVHLPLAVRGERLALNRVRPISADGFELSLLSVSESDGAGRLRRLTTFDDTDLLGALDTLESRHRELVGDAYTEADRIIAVAAATLAGYDVAGMDAVLAPDLVSTDHRPIGYGTLDRDALLAFLRTRSELTPVTTSMLSKIYRSDRASLLACRTTGRTAADSEYEWVYAMVYRHAANGLVTHLDVFADDQWSEAVALFDEWSTGLSRTNLIE